MTDLTPNHPAVAAVLELHKPVQARMTSSDGVRDVTVCDHCLDPTWPCQTVAAITTARAVIPADTLVDPLDDHHPAVQAAARAALAEGWTCDTHEPLPWGECRDCTESHLRTARRALTAALPHLVADDLRHTDAAEEIRTEGWQQGWAAGRDLDGDEDATPYLRDTPAGRALMAEGWDALIESMSASGEFHDVDLRTMQRLNPYLEDDE